MQFGKSLLIATVISLMYISPSNSQDKKPLSNWIEFCPNSQLCFERPLSLIPAEVIIIDSIAGQLDNEDFTLFYDLGLYASTFGELTTASSEPIIIDGHLGKVLIEKNKMALSIQSLAGKMGFAMLIEFKNVIQLEQGRRIFKSVKFKL
tara:strand:- start:83 stop:529 length:447 start_codon:yes stop_codon:yes gene_type:complete